jgi:hypothetical protein
MTTRFDFSGVEQFLACLEGKISPEQVFAHPAYQTVALHARQFGTGLNAVDVKNALAGRPSPFYGLVGFLPNLPRIKHLLTYLRQQAAEWSAVIEFELRALFPDEKLNIIIYPIFGYDMGIGLDNSVCMNLNCPAYLDEPMEFLFYAIHECTHVLYERRHPIPILADIHTPAEWRSYFNLWTQNEGFAVYAPLRLREKLGYLNERDCRILFDGQALEFHRLEYLSAFERLLDETPLEREAYLEICFGDRRLTYRLGCELLRRMNHANGLAAMQSAFFMDGDEFMERYKCLLLE